MTKKPIDPIAVKQAIRDGQLEVFEKDGKIYLRDGDCGDCVMILALEEASASIRAAIKNLLRYYEIARNNDWVNDKVAWSLYQAWKDAGRGQEHVDR